MKTKTTVLSFLAVVVLVVLGGCAVGPGGVYFGPGYASGYCGYGCYDGPNAVYGYGPYYYSGKYYRSYNPKHHTYRYWSVKRYYYYY